MTIFDDGAVDLWDTWPEAVAATFTPLSGPEVTGFKIVIDSSLKYLPEGFDAQTWGNNVTIEYLVAQVGREAKQGEKFTAGGVTYTVVDVMENDGRFCKVIAR